MRPNSSRTGFLAFAIIVAGTTPMLSQTGAQPAGEESRGAVRAPIGWHKLEAGAFSLFAPLGWEFHQRQGIDSYVGKFVGEGVVLNFDFGGYSSGYLKKATKPAYVIGHESIGGFRAKIVSPRTPGHGLTGIYFRRTFGSNELCLYGEDLTSVQQELVLRIFETIRFGHKVPPIFAPPVPPPPPPVSQNGENRWFYSNS
ncbi:MAG: hypothetical protein ABSF45_15285 [Terriglobia bacterium]